MFRQSDRQKCQALFERYYRGREFHDALYLKAIKQHVKPGDRVLDAGCGRYLKFGFELAKVAHVTGIDIDPISNTNNAAPPFGVQGDLSYLPFPAEHFDVVISRSVIEHLAEPGQVFREFVRVLKPGGTAILITPNKYDYVSLIANVTPYRLHRALVSRIFQVSADDVFPTLYRANTLSSLQKALLRAGFENVEVDTINHYPAYLSFSPLLYRLGILYERLTSTRYLKGLRSSLLSVARKRAAQEAHDSGVALADERTKMLGVA